MMVCMRGPFAPCGRDGNGSEGLQRLVQAPHLVRQPAPSGHGESWCASSLLCRLLRWLALLALLLGVRGTLWLGRGSTLRRGSLLVSLLKSLLLLELALLLLLGSLLLLELAL